ncbi:hypothetical protein [Ulvibacter sp. MAR_2010_11]|uniref:hypothetical protein n=1 Tax=Ulvibacter sp. MAR_2010_11 TaxID=1250229 RepID=UPI0012FDFA7A|nr:hypothetical protein [Ulvibacter sp. MAR_2010_11]
MKDIKYLAAFSIPVGALIGLLLRGCRVFITPIFVIILLSPGWFSMMNNRIPIAMRP